MSQVNRTPLSRSKVNLQGAGAYCGGLPHSLLSLQESYSLLVLMYAAPALSLSNRQIDELGACWNSVIRRIFGYSRTESVKAVLFGLGRLNVKRIIMQRKVKFFKHLWFSGNCYTQCFYLFF